MRITPLDEWIRRKTACPHNEISREWMADYQIQKINATLAAVKANSRFYRSVLERFPPQIYTLDEFAGFPFISASDIRENPADFLCVPQNDVSRIVTLNTTGTTGPSKRCYFTLQDQELTIDFFGVGMSTLVEAGDRVLILLPGDVPGNVGDLLQIGLGRVGVQAYKHGPVLYPEETLLKIVGLNVNCLVGVPSQVKALVEYSKIHKDDYPVHIKSVLLSTDYVPEAIEQSINSVWNCEVVNHYGMTEMGLGGGVFCTARYGYHLREADLYFEIIDPVSGRVLPDGQEGEVVFTTLTRQAMPLMRYRTGDISCFLVEKCPCGTNLKTLAKIKGRVDQRIAIGSEFFTIADFDEVLFRLDGILNYKMEVDRTGKKDQLNFVVYSITERDKQSEIILQAIGSMNKAFSDLEIKLEIIKGYPPELGSMKKRQIVEICRDSPRK